MLPLLSTVINAPNMNWTILDETTTRALDSMTSFLTQFSLSHEHDAAVKSAAASCLFSILVNSKVEEDRPLALFRDEISGMLAEAPNRNSAASSSSLPDDSTIEDALNMAALLVSFRPPNLHSYEDLIEYFLGVSCCMQGWGVVENSGSSHFISRGTCLHWKIHLSFFGSANCT